MYRFLTSLGPKKKRLKRVRRASKPQTAESKAFRCQPGKFLEAPQGQVHMEAVGSELRRHTGHTHAHTHTEGKLLDYSGGGDSVP